MVMLSRRSLPAMILPRRPAAPRRPRASVPLRERHPPPAQPATGATASGCHGKAEGQNGFKLSVFGFDPESDYPRPRHGGPRPAAAPLRTPEASLFLRKMSGEVPHGGRRTHPPPGTAAYDTIRRLDRPGRHAPSATRTPRTSSRVPRSSRARAVLAMGGSQRLRVTAKYSGRPREST